MKTVLSSIHRAGSKRLLLAWAIALSCALILPLVGIDREMEQQLANVRASILEKPASGKIAIVEIDAKSIQQIDNWPWPRTHYADLVRKLSESGAAQIAFDVDFSSHSTPAHDAALAVALKKSDVAVILPTFKQKASSTGVEYAESLPIPELRQDSLLASVNVHPDKYGQLNEYSYGTVTENTVRPSLASMLAEHNGDIGEKFAIDQSIDPATIPRYSFIDIMNSSGPIAEVSGKHVIIGATAIELGDRYPISRYGVLPGVVIQAMAAETLIQGTNVVNLGFIPSYMFTAILLLVWISRQKNTDAAIFTVTVTAGTLMFVILLATEKFALFTFSIVPAFALIGLFVIADKILKTTWALRRSTLFDTNSELPNEAAMIKAIDRRDTSNIATARLTDYRDLLVLTNKESRVELFRNLANRLKFLAVDDRIYHVETDTLAWIVKDEYERDIGGHFDTASALFHSPVLAGDTKIKLNAFFGIGAETIDKAKIAAEQAKTIGEKWAWHDDDASKAIGIKQNLLVEIEQAVENKDIWVEYQPKWNMIENRLDGAEALVRWNHPQTGPISPEVFIPLLEKAGRIDRLTLVVLETALNDLRNWTETQSSLVCAINISANLIGNSGFIERAIAMVDNANLGVARVIFEVTETAALADMELSAQALERIQEAGIIVSIDDYGTGQSTMSYLQRLPVDEIKIDQSFIKTMMTNQSNQLMVKSTIELAHALGLKVVAEGIEDKSCMEMLENFGCDVGQGWHISKPVSSDVFKSKWMYPDQNEEQKQTTAN